MQDDVSVSMTFSLLLSAEFWLEEILHSLNPLIRKIAFNSFPTWNVHLIDGRGERIWWNV